MTVINAEVQLMKCIVDGMMVDVSANQFGGLASLGFLEETNTFIGRDDLFVRSIILVKAWGFYEGRILGRTTRSLRLMRWRRSFCTSSTNTTPN